MNRIGSFALLNSAPEGQQPSATLRVTDPCYTDMTTWCAGTLDNVAVGIWNTFVEIYEGEWRGQPDHRVAELIIRHDEHPDAWPTEPTEIHVGVDSGQAGFFCETTFRKVAESKYGEPGFYGTCCSLTSGSEHCANTVGFGAVSSSGWGDGGYELFIHRAKTIFGERIVAARIVFISDEEIEELENDEIEDGEELEAAE